MTTTNDQSIRFKIEHPIDKNVSYEMTYGFEDDEELRMHSRTNLTDNKDSYVYEPPILFDYDDDPELYDAALQKCLDLLSEENITNNNINDKKILSPAIVDATATTTSEKEQEQQQQFVSKNKHNKDSKRRQTKVIVLKMGNNSKMRKKNNSNKPKTSTSTATKHKQYESDDLKHDEKLKDFEDDDDDDDDMFMNLDENGRPLKRSKRGRAKKNRNGKWVNLLDNYELAYLNRLNSEKQQRSKLPSQDKKKDVNLFDWDEIRKKDEKRERRLKRKNGDKNSSSLDKPTTTTTPGETTPSQTKRKRKAETSLSTPVRNLDWMKDQANYCAATQSILAQEGFF